MYFGICKERTAFVSVSRQVCMLVATSACGSSWTFLFTFIYVMYVMTGLMSDSQALMVPPLHGSLQSIRYYKNGDAIPITLI